MARTRQIRRRLGQLGEVPIECGWSDPQCLQGVYWGGGNQWFPGNLIPPPIDQVPIPHEPPTGGDGLPQQTVTATQPPPATLPGPADPAPSIWEQPASGSTAIFVVGGVLAVVVGLSFLKR